VKKRTLCAILLLTLPACATIANVQSNANWTCSGSGPSITCKVTLTTQPTTTKNLLAVWTFWQSTSTYAASVFDSQSNGINGFFPSAVGPTLQSAASTPTSGQIFYAASITGSGVGHDQVTVTFTGPAGGSISSAGVVAVEYSGLDIYYPLDNVSAAYSTSGNPTALLDSGTVAPANSNLLLFAGGVSDSGTANAGTGFTGIQSHNFSSGMAITEQNTSTITGNNVLQRATACLSDVSCLAPVGDWVMQMAVFRDASWTVGGGWPPARFGKILDASQFPGSDIGAQITNAAAACQNPRGCTVHVPAGFYPYTTPVMLSSGPNGTYPITLECEAGGDSTGGTYGTTTLYFTPTTGVAVTFNVGPPGGGINGCTIFGSGSGNGTTGLYVEGGSG